MPVFSHPLVSSYDKFLQTAVGKQPQPEQLTSGSIMPPFYWAALSETASWPQSSPFFAYNQIVFARAFTSMPETAFHRFQSPIFIAPYHKHRIVKFKGQTVLAYRLYGSAVSYVLQDFHIHLSRYACLFPFRRAERDTPLKIIRPES